MQVIRHNYKCQCVDVASIVFTNHSVHNDTAGKQIREKTRSILGRRDNVVSTISFAMATNAQPVSTSFVGFRFLAHRTQSVCSETVLNADKSL